MISHTFVEENNSRLAPRAFPDRQLETWYTPTPTETRQTRFPVLAQTRASGSSGPFGENMIDYSAADTFAAVQRTAPFRGFIRNIDTESALRSQFFALQRGDQAVYVPSSQSDLYNRAEAVGRQTKQTHPLLFHDEVLVITPKNPKKNIAVETTGNDLFANNTRVQLRNHARR